MKTLTTDSLTTSKNEFMICDFESDQMKKIIKFQKFMEIARYKISEFTIVDSNRRSLDDLFLYFHGNTGTLDLKKGIYMFGEFGCGKTSIFGLFSKYLASEFPFSKNGFGNVSIEQVLEDWKKDKNVEKYLFSSYSGKPVSYCFHEIGKKLNEQFYGTDVNQIINSLMMRRYELFQRYGTRTHVTSNFAPNKLSCFDNAVLDRLKEMFNFVEWHGGSFRI